MYGSRKPVKKMTDDELRREVIRTGEQQAAEASPGRPASRGTDRARVKALTEAQKRGGIL